MTGASVRRALAFAYAVLVILSLPCIAQASPPINVGPDGVAIKGYDPVAYFTAGKAVQGSPEFQYEWKGATWRFSSEENRDLFKATPEKYAPQYGGY